MRWKITEVKKVKLKDPILLEGLPGIGNVGKIAADFIVDELKGEKIYDIFSYSMPHSVFVNEENLVELPKIEIFHVKAKRDILILVGDMQPIDEESTYEFSDQVLDLCKSIGVKEVVTLGGIGLHEMPEKPKVFCTGSTRKAVDAFIKGTKLKNKVYGVIGPIMGVSGLLVGLSEKKGVHGICILAETLGHPMFLGIKGAKAMLKELDKKLELNINLRKLNKEIKAMEQEMKNTEEVAQTQETKKGGQVNYIG